MHVLIDEKGKFLEKNIHIILKPKGISLSGR